MHWIRYLTQVLITCEVALSSRRRRHGRDADELEGRANHGFNSDQHPELRSSVALHSDDDKTEFVRQEWTDAVYKKLRTYSYGMDFAGYVNTYSMLAVLLSMSTVELCRAYDPGSIPRQIECFSCMSLSYQTSWKYLQTIYIYPKVFTDRCRDPGNERGMPTVLCSTVCVSLLEPDIEAGVFIGYKHIRGCMDRVLRHGFNQTALRTHRFHQHNQCRTLSRAHLFNPARASDPPAIGDVQLCSCYGDRCNGSNSSEMTKTFISFVISAIFVCLFQ